MTNLFYLIGLWYMLTEINWIVSPIEQAQKARDFNKMIVENKGKTWKEYSDKYKEAIKNRLMVHLIPFIWLIIGFMSAQWILFIFLFLFQMIAIKIAAPFRNYWVFTLLHWIVSVVVFSTVLFIIINHYHLHIDIYQLLKSRF